MLYNYTTQCIGNYSSNLGIQMNQPAQWDDRDFSTLLHRAGVDSWDQRDVYVLQVVAVGMSNSNKAMFPSIEQYHMSTNMVKWGLYSPLKQHLVGSANVLVFQPSAQSWAQTSLSIPMSSGNNLSHILHVCPFFWQYHCIIIFVG